MHGPRRGRARGPAAVRAFQCAARHEVVCSRAGAPRAGLWTRRSLLSRQGVPRCGSRSGSPIADPEGVVQVMSSCALSCERSLDLGASWCSACTGGLGTASTLAFRLPGEDAGPGVPESRSPGVPESRSPGVPESRSPGVPESRSPGVPESRSPGVPESRSPGVPESRSPGVPVSRCPGVPVSPVSPCAECASAPVSPVSRCPGVPVSRCPGVPVPWQRSGGEPAADFASSLCTRRDTPGMWPGWCSVRLPVMLSLVADEAENGTAETVTGSQTRRCSPTGFFSGNRHPRSSTVSLFVSGCRETNASLASLGEGGVRLVLENSTACTLSMPIY